MDVVVIDIRLACLVDHEQGLVEVIAVRVDALDGGLVVCFGQDAPVVIIVAGGGAVGNGLDPPAEGVVGVVGQRPAGVGDAGEAVFVAQPVGP